MSLVAALSARSAMENVCADSNGTVALVWKPTDMEHVTKLVHAQNNVLREVYAELQLHRCDELLHERASQCCKDVCIPAPGYVTCYTTLRVHCACHNRRYCHALAM